MYTFHPALTSLFFLSFSFLSASACAAACASSSSLSCSASTLFFTLGAFPLDGEEARFVLLSLILMLQLLDVVRNTHRGEQWKAVSYRRSSWDGWMDGGCKAWCGCRMSGSEAVWLV
jgi:hypothetical protein